MKDGQLETFEELMEEMVEGTSAEPKTLAYEWYISEDGGTVHILEKYADSDPMIEHVTGFLDKWARRFMGCVDVRASSSTATRAPQPGSSSPASARRTSARGAASRGSARHPLLVDRGSSIEG